MFLNSSLVGLKLLNVEVRDNKALHGDGGGIYNVKPTVEETQPTDSALTSCMSSALAYLCMQQEVFRMVFVIYYNKFY